ncbi:hypothetical protein AVEN_125293-1 [Araneus ventricosus]|uniref:Uncharacterized protein n=1 Tax=Araneus ventricosus TaxID=182803 RepID=A0A4Y2EP14_ARAVE|nr:hypothetical protein AVEN_125293-1 [Araneus ventricosus]
MSETASPSHKNFHSIATGGCLTPESSFSVHHAPSHGGSLNRVMDLECPDPKGETRSQWPAEQWWIDQVAILSDGKWAPLHINQYRAPRMCVC